MIESNKQTEFHLTNPEISEIISTTMKHENDKNCSLIKIKSKAKNNLKKNKEKMN